MTITQQYQRFTEAVNDMIARGETEGLNVDVLMAYAWGNACDVPEDEIADVAIATARMYCDDRDSVTEDMIAA